MYINHGVKVPTTSTFQQNKPSRDSIWKNNLEFPGLTYEHNQQCSNQKEHVGTYERVTLAVSSQKKSICYVPNVTHK